MNPRVSYGDGVPDDTTLRLCGDLAGGRRALELGISDAFNALAFAAAEGKAIAVDPEPERIADLRARAATAELTIECHGADLADLGFATSGSIELAVANHTLSAVADPGRVLRQVSRVLKQSAPLIIAVDHPFAAVSRGEVSSYGANALTVSDWFVQLSRANFRVDTMLELGVDESPVPTTLIIRARKEGS